MTRPLPLEEHEVTRTRTLQVEERTSDGLVEVTDVGDDEGSIALMAEMGWVRSKLPADLFQVIAAQGIEGDGILKIAEHVFGGRGAIPYPQEPTKAPMPSPSPKTIEELHQILGWLVAEGYEPARETDPVAKVCISGKVWAIDSAWFIGTTAPSVGGDVAVDCRAVRRELEEQAKVVIDSKPAAHGLNGAPGFTPAGELEVGTPQEKPKMTVVCGECLGRRIRTWRCSEHGLEGCFACKACEVCPYCSAKSGQPEPVEKKTLSELLDDKVPAELATGHHGNGTVASVMATVAVLVEVLSAELGRRF